MIFYFLLQGSRLGEVVPVEVDVEHRMLRPFRLQLFHGQPLEQVFLSLEIAFEGGHQQALAETAGTAEEIDLPIFD